MASQLHGLLSGYMHDVWNNGNISSIGQYLSSDFVCHDPYQPTITGLSESSLFVKQMRSTFANCQIRIEDTVEEGEYIACRLRHTGEHRGEFLDRSATGCEVINSVMCLWRVKDGQFCELWQHWDAFGVCRQIDDASGAERLPDGLVFDPGPTSPTATNVNAAQVSENKQTVQRWMDGAWNNGDFDLVDQCFTEDMWFWDPFGPVITGREGFREWAGQINTAFSNRKLSIDHVIAEGNKTAYRVTLRAKHSGEFLGAPATGKDVKASAMIIAVHENGCYKKAYQVFDVLKVFRDIGQA